MTSVSTSRRQGLNSSAAIKVPCRVASTANLTLNGLQTVDGVALATGDRVLVKDQTDTTENGIYVTDTGAWTRDLDFDGTYDAVKGTRVIVNEGSAGAGTMFYVSSATPTIGTSAITFAAAAFGGDVAALIHGAANKATPVGADELGISDSAASWILKKLTLTNLAAFLASLVQTLTNKTIAAATNTVEARSAPNGSAFGFRNKITNGEMQVAQRGTTGVLTTVWAWPSIDRFAAVMPTSAAGALTQTAFGSGEFNKMAALFRTPASALTNALSIGQAVETSNSVSLQGKPITFSFYAKAGANFSASGSNITVQVYTGTGTDQSINNLSAWTGASAVINTAQAITTTLTRYTFTANLAASITQIGFWISFTPTGTAGADDSLYITGIQLEEGSVATPFEHRSYGTELSLCQRYYYRRNSISTTDEVAVLQAYATNGVFGKLFDFPVEMRAAPTCAISAIGHFTPSIANGNAAASAMTGGGTITASTRGCFTPTMTGAFATLVAGNASVLTFNTAAGWIDAASEL